VYGGGGGCLFKLKILFKADLTLLPKLLVSLLAAAEPLAAIQEIIIATKQPSLNFAFILSLPNKNQLTL
jgi:hypothetical protein